MLCFGTKFATRRFKPKINASVGLFFVHSPEFNLGKFFKHMTVFTPNSPGKYA